MRTIMIYILKYYRVCIVVRAYPKRVMDCLLTICVVIQIRGVGIFAASTTTNLGASV